MLTNIPWKYLRDEGQFIVDAKGNIIAEIPCQGCDPNAGDVIVNAVNGIDTHKIGDESITLADLVDDDIERFPMTPFEVHLEEERQAAVIAITEAIGIVDALLKKTLDASISLRASLTLAQGQQKES